MALKEFNADKNRAARAAAKIVIEEQEFRRRRMTGARFREILNEEPDEGQIKSEDELADLTPAERGEYERGRALAYTQSVYEAIAQLLEPVNPDAIGVAVDDEQALTEWLVDNLDWDDAPALQQWLNDLRTKPGNAAA